VRRRLGRDRWARIGSDAIAGERARLAVRRPPTGAIERVLIGGNWCAGARGACPLRGLSFRALPERKPPLPRGQPPRRRGACGPVPHRPRSRRRASGAVDRFPPPTAVPRNRRGTSLCAGGGRCPVSRGRRASVPPVGLRRRGVLGTRCSRTKTQDTVRGTNPPGPYPWALSVPSPGSRGLMTRRRAAEGIPLKNDPISGTIRGFWGPERRALSPNEPHRAQLPATGRVPARPRCSCCPTPAKAVKGTRRWP
jgi:hypothetical protein